MGALWFAARRLSILSFLILSSAYLLSGYMSDRPYIPEAASRQAFHKAVLNKLLEADHVFIPAASPAFEAGGYRVRTGWGGMPDFQVKVLTGRGQVLTLSGSRISFNILNVTSILILLDNKSHQRDRNYRGDDRNVGQRPTEIDPAHVLVRIGRSRTLFFSGNRHTVLHVDIETIPTKPTRVEIMYLGTLSHARVLTFEGIWFNTYGSLISTIDAGHSRAQNGSGEIVHEQKTIAQQHSFSKKRRCQNRIETYTSLLSVSSPQIASGFERGINEPQTSTAYLLEKSKFFNATTISISVPPYLCLTRRCHGGPLNDEIERESPNPKPVTAADLYFRSGLPNTHLYKRPWTYPSHLVPSMIVLELGFWDFYAIFSDITHPSSSPSTLANERVLSRFTTRFIDDFVMFIQTVRRNLPDPDNDDDAAYEASSTAIEKKKIVTDRSFIYNSAPSTTPIFLLPPPLPPSYDSIFVTTIFNTLSRIRHKLNDVEGDKSTFLIDTSGWLEKTDFYPAETGTSYANSFLMQHDKDQEKTTITSTFHKKQGANATDKQTEQSPFPIPILTPKGHQRFAYFLSLHLCPYLQSPLSSSSSVSTTTSKPLIDRENPDQNCPFSTSDDKHSAYKGNMFVPQEKQMSSFLEERKIQRVKEKLFPQF